MQRGKAPLRVETSIDDSVDTDRRPLGRSLWEPSSSLAAQVQRSGSVPRLTARPPDSAVDYTREEEQRNYHVPHFERRRLR